MDTGRREHTRPRHGDRALTRRQIVSHYNQPRQPLKRAAQYLVAIRVKGVCLDVAVRIDEPRRSHARGLLGRLRHPPAPVDHRRLRRRRRRWTRLCGVCACVATDAVSSGPDPPRPVRPRPRPRLPLRPPRRPPRSPPRCPRRTPQTRGRVPRWVWRERASLELPASRSFWEAGCLASRPVRAPP